MKGDKLWTEEECNILQAIGPEFDIIHQKLPNRTRVAIASQCRKMGMKQKVQHIWSAAEISKLRKLYPSASREEICQIFPHSTWVNIRQTARYHGFRRTRKPYKSTGNQPIDTLLERCVAANMTLVDLDKECHTKNYFRKQKWRSVRPNYSRFVKAIELFEGQLKAEWTADE